MTTPSSVPRRPRRWPQLIAAMTAAAVALTAGPAPGAEAAPAAAAATVPSPAITVPPPGTHGFPFLAEAEDLTAAGYTESEYFLSGVASSYTGLGVLGSNGRWPVAVTGRAPYRTRMLVRRPADPARFNGVVLVEWLNVSGQVDLSPDYWFAHDELLRAGYAWVGVSAQKVGVDGGIGDLPGLRQWDPARYGTLNHPGDQFSYDIFSQAGQALRTPGGPDPLAGLDVRTVLADGESQSALRMTTYVNAIHPVAKVYDGFLIHSNSALAAPIDALGLGMPLAVRIRTDLRQPTFVVLTETDVAGHAPARQPDTATVHTWELAGTAHGDQWALDRGDPTLRRSLGSQTPAPDCPAGSAPPNDGPGHYGIDAALAHLTTWARGGTAPPAAPPVTLLGGAVIRDPATGLALGGLRLPDVTVPTHTLSGLRAIGGGPFCGLYGARDPWNADADGWDRHDTGDPSDPALPVVAEPDLATLYPTHARYVAAVQAAADTAVAAGYLLAPDAARIVATAQASPIGGQGAAGSVPGKS
ncbi:alpha/beta hydrolase domain-containing protein [Actinoplanes sp. NPDC020271]|uniref:alpha/beta hydrolase domain-containing protein n=1 Tax=Actinoplanes sp. NPDC020271 TaxID=3363896 RepID=UPI0037B5687D